MEEFHEHANLGKALNFSATAHSLPSTSTYQLEGLPEVIADG